MKLKTSNIKSLEAADLCSYSFFPEELPPCFRSYEMGTWVSTLSRTKITSELAKRSDRYKVEQIDTYGARYGGLIRRHSTPSPNAYIKLALEVERSKIELSKFIDSENLSASKPTTNHRYRSIGLTYRFQDLLRLKNTFAKGSNWLLRADVSNCFPSIYTHSVPWALHGKVSSKKNIGKWNFLGNRLDRFLMDCQHGETKGIPIGPDTSRLVSEIILGAVDSQLSGVLNNAFRFMDDYWIFCSSKEEAEDCLGALQIELIKYRLNVNPAKTRIYEHENKFEDEWVSIARREIPKKPYLPKSILKYQKLLSDFEVEYKQTPGIKYLFTSIVKNIPKDKVNDDVIDLLLTYVEIELALIPDIIRHLGKAKLFGQYELVILDRFEALIPKCIRLGHHIELAWLLWIALENKWEYKTDLMIQASKVESNFISLLIMAHVSEGLCETIDFPFYDEVESLHDDPNYLSNWLFRYECALKGWLDPAPLDNLGLQEIFNAGVRFFNEDIGDKSWYTFTKEYG